MRSLFALCALTMMLHAQDLQIPFTKHVLDNGLEVVIHEDHSEPVVSVYVVYHVGSGREELGRSGFAHLFEHLMFQGSQHVGDDQHFKLLSEAGGTLNGTTNRDRTNYFETVPSHELELALWLEADRMGFLLPAITQENLDNQREVVKNERRQNYENRPYAQARGRVSEALYPHGHPYSWTTIGSHEDLTAASLDDVQNFFRRWYGPNNATLAIGGDVTPERALELVRKYFDSIPRGPEVHAPASRPAGLEQSVRLAMEDKVQLPQLSFTWPSPDRSHPDGPTMSMLAAVLSANKAALLDRALMVDETLASSVSAFHSGGDLAGEFQITVRAAPGISLDTLERKVHEILDELARNGVDPEHLQRMKNRYELSVVSSFETVARRTGALADANAMRGDPAIAAQRLAKALAVTPAEVDRVLREYVIDKPAVVMSVVPEGKREMAASGRSEVQTLAEGTLDRSVRPEPGTPRDFTVPDVWSGALANGVEVLGTPFTAIPIVKMRLSVPAGNLRETRETLGLSSLTAALMNEGTEGLSATEFTDALDDLGASVGVSSGSDSITVTIQALQRQLPATIDLVTEMLLRPRFSQEDFDRIRDQRVAQVETRGDSIRTVAFNVWSRLMYDDADLSAWPSGGTLETLSALTVDDVRAFHRQHVVPNGATLTVVGDLDAAAVDQLFFDLTSNWKGGTPAPVATSERPSIGGTRVFLVDKPGAAQSEIRIGHPGVASSDPMYYPLTVMNHSLGGTFSSRINLNLREDKGYTYGARTRFSGDPRTGTFAASAGVRTDVTRESVEEFMKELHSFREGLTEEEVAFTRDGLMAAMGRQFESSGRLEAMLRTMVRDGLPADYPAQRREWLSTVERGELSRLAREAIDPDRMVILVVGDAAVVREGLEDLGYGEVTELDIDGDVVDGGS